MPFTLVKGLLDARDWPEQHILHLVETVQYTKAVSYTHLGLRHPHTGSGTGGAHPAGGA